MIVYIVVLGLGLMFLYTLRDGLLAWQNYQDRKLADTSDKSNDIIAQSEKYCKQIKKAG